MVFLLVGVVGGVLRGREGEENGVVSFIVVGMMMMMRGTG